MANEYYVSEITLPDGSIRDGDTRQQGEALYKIKDVEAVERTGDTMTGDLYIDEKRTGYPDHKIMLGRGDLSSRAGLHSTSGNRWLIHGSYDEKDAQDNPQFNVYINNKKITNSTRNLVFATPDSPNGGDASLRILTQNDIPELNASKITAGTLPAARGGTGLSTNNLTGNAGKVIKVNSGGTGFVLADDNNTTYGINQKTVAGLVAAPYVDENNKHENTVWREGTGNPQWGKVTLTTMVEGVLPVANGGTGKNLNLSANANKFLKVNAAGDGFILANDNDTTYGINQKTTAGLVAAPDPNSTNANQNTVWREGTGNPQWGKVTLSTMVEGTLPVGNGGTGKTSFTNNYVLLGGGVNSETNVAQPIKQISQDSLRKSKWLQKQSPTNPKLIHGTNNAQSSGATPETSMEGWNIEEFYYDNTYSLYHAFGTAGLSLYCNIQQGSTYWDQIQKWLILPTKALYSTIKTILYLNIGFSGKYYEESENNCLTSCFTVNTHSNVNGINLIEIKAYSLIQHPTLPADNPNKKGYNYFMPVDMWYIAEKTTNFN